MKELPTATLRALWVGCSGNKKTGEIPVSYVGETVEETKASCGKCPELPWNGGRCFAWKNRLRMSLASVQKSARARPGRYTLEHAINMSPKGAKVARHAVIGNASWCGVESVLEQERKLRAAGMTGIGFDHEWHKSKNQPLKDVLLASCGNFQSARLASQMGWIVSVIVPQDAEGPVVADGHGYRYRICPNDENPAVQCKDCGLCTPTHPIWKRGDLAGIAFLEKKRKKANVH